jgi:hypothetical protein
MGNESSQGILPFIVHKIVLHSDREVRAGVPNRVVGNEYKRVILIRRLAEKDLSY